MRSTSDHIRSIVFHPVHASGARHIAKGRRALSCPVQLQPSTAGVLVPWTWVFIGVAIGVISSGILWICFLFDPCTRDFLCDWRDDHFAVLVSGRFAWTTFCGPDYSSGVLERGPRGTWKYIRKLDLSFGHQCVGLRDQQLDHHYDHTHQSQFVPSFGDERSNMDSRPGRTTISPLDPWPQPLHPHAPDRQRAATETSGQPWRILPHIILLWRPFWVFSRNKLMLRETTWTVDGFAAPLLAATSGLVKFWRLRPKNCPFSLAQILFIVVGPPAKICCFNHIKVIWSIFGIRSTCTFPSFLEFSFWLLAPMCVAFDRARFNRGKLRPQNSQLQEWADYHFV